MKRARIVVTGPSGWIGQAFLAEIAAREGPGWAEQVTLFGSRERALAAPDGTVLQIRPLESISPADVVGAHVLHLAYLTKEKVGALGERAFFDINIGIDTALAKALATGSPAGLFVASSGAARLAADGRDVHPYGIGKLRQEDRFVTLGAQRGFPVTAGRIWNIAGPYINKLESYAISNFIVQARRTGVIRIDATVPVYRAYLHVADLAKLALTSLARGIGADGAIDLTGPLVVEMDDVAHTVAQATGIGEDAIVRGPVDYDTPSLYLGDPTPARTLALRFGFALRDFSSQVADTIDYVDRVLADPSY